MKENENLISVPNSLNVLTTILFYAGFTYSFYNADRYITQHTSRLWYIICEAVISSSSSSSSSW